VAADGAAPGVFSAASEILLSKAVDIIQTIIAAAKNKVKQRL
jgi:hypothetical protein